MTIRKLKHYLHSKFRSLRDYRRVIGTFVLILLISLSTYFALSYFAVPSAPKLKNGWGDVLYSASNKYFSTSIGTKDGSSKIDFSVGKSSASFVLAGSDKVIPKKLNSNTVVFPGVQKNTDIQYTTTPNGLKEEIVLSALPENNVFLFDLSLNGVVPKKIANDFIDSNFTDEKGQYQFNFEKPFALDADGNRTDNVLLQISEDKQVAGTYSIKLIVDPRWLSSPDRIYPITIDPTLVHDTTSEFAAGYFDRIKDTGSGSLPSLESYYQELPADQYTVGLWHLNESSGVTANDATQNHLDGTITGTTIVSGLLSNARSFNGTSDKITLGTGAVGTKLNGSSAMTYSAWAKMNATPGGNTTLSAFYINATTTGIKISFTPTTIECAARSVVGDGAQLVTTSLPPIGAWTHIACVADYPNDRMYLYVNGILANTTAVAFANTSFTYGTASAGDTIGSNNAADFLNGSLDEIKLSNIALSAEEIKASASRRRSAVYTSPVLDLNPITSWNSLTWNELGVTTAQNYPYSLTSMTAFYQLDHTSGTSAVIAQGSCGTCTLTLTNFASTGSQDAIPLSGWTSNNRLNGFSSLMFDGTNDYLTCTDANCGGSSNFDFGTSDFSFGAWIKTNTGTNSEIVRKGTGSGAYYLFRVLTNKLQFAYYDGTTTVSAAGNTIVSDNTWHYVVVSVSRSTGVKLYVDGKLDGSGTGSATNSMNNGDNFCIGASSAVSSCIGELFGGIIDMVSIYARALNNNEIMSVYNASNIELQTRVGSTTNPNDGTWEAWKSTTGETTIDNMDNPLDYATPSASIFPRALVATSAATTLPVIEGNKSLKIQTGQITSLSNVVGMWHLDETSGTGAYLKDSSSTGAHMTPSGSSSEPGITMKGRNFTDSGNDYLGVSSILGLDTGNGGGGGGGGGGTTNSTIDLWVKLDSTSESGSFVKIGSGNGYAIGVGSTSFEDSGNNLILLYEGVRWINTSVPIGTGWHHVAMTVSEAGYPSAFLDGVLVYMDKTGAPSTPTAGGTYIGGYPGSDRYVDAIIDEVRISNIPRSYQEIAETYRMGSNHYLNKTISSIDLYAKSNLPFYVAADRPGTYLSATLGKSLFSNYQPDSNTRGLWHLEEKNPETTPSTIKYSSTNVAAGNAYTYWKTLSDSSTVRTGYTFEYDVYLGTNTTQTGGVDIRFTDTTYARSASWADQNVLGCTGADLTPYAYGSWYHRVCTIPAALDGKVISWIDLVNENDTATPTIAYYDNFILRTPAGVIVSTMYISGSPGFNVVDINSNAGNTGSAVVDTTVPASSIIDSSGLNNTLNSYTTTTTTGKIGGGRNFTGSVTDTLSCSDSVCGGTSKLDPSTGSWSMGAWVKTTKVPAQNFITKGTTTGQYAYTIDFENGGSPKFILHNTVNGDYIAASASARFNDGYWHHVAGTYDGTNANIYVDGQLQATSSTKTGTQVTNSTSMFQIGGRADAAQLSWLGQIDEVFVTASAPTADNIRQMFDSGRHTHPITIDFNSAISHQDPLSSSSDLTFQLMATPSGTSNAGDYIYPGDKIIVKENYDGTEYIAQGTVNTVDIVSGNTTVSSWDAGSTFPSIGYTPNAVVFKWQREYWRIDGILPINDLASITNLTLRVTGGGEGRTIWLDDLRSNSGYITNPTYSAITSATGNRYFQYRAILSSFDEAVSATLSAVTIDYVSNVVSNTPTLDLPSDTATNQSLLPILKTTGTDTNSDYLRYKIELCTNLAMSIGCQTFDQTNSQTGWSGQNAQTSTAYTSGTQATYTLQSLLTPATTYYWRSYAIDPAGTNTWSTTQTPRSFTTTNSPTPPTSPYTEGSTNPVGVVDTTPEFSAVHSDPNSDAATYYQIEVNTNNTFTGTVMWDTGTVSMSSLASGARSSDVSYGGTTLTPNGATYYWRIRFTDTNNAVGSWSATASFTMENAPGVPSLNIPSNTATGQILRPVLITTAVDPESDYLRYKIELCTNVGMSAGCQLFDQTSSQTGWSGQNTQTSTAYTSGTPATYTLQSPLAINTTYYWRSYAADPAGSNAWSGTQSAPFSFTTEITPETSIACRIQETYDDASLTVAWNDVSPAENGYSVERSVDGALFASLAPSLAADTTSYQDATITTGHTYAYRVAPFFTGPILGDWCTTSTLSVSKGTFKFENINFR